MPMTESLALSLGNDHSTMKNLVILSLFFLNALGNPLVSLVKDFEDMKGKCVMATDLKCPRDDITFWLYTKSNPNGIKLEAGSLGKAPWSKGPLKFIVHGYSVNKDTAVNAVLRPAYLAAGEYNIISVDWSALGRKGCYAQAVQNVPTIAKCVAEFFKAVTKAGKFSDVHLLGHSMGAHVAAWASVDIPKLPRLTKFDVANPLFNSRNSKNGSAGFIDVYHSNSGLKGQKEPSGDVDIFFNNEAFQPGCKCDTSCSHLRAVWYYSESIGKTLKAFPCGGWEDYVSGNCKVPSSSDLVVVGENANTKVKGTYMAFTKSKPPYLLQEDYFYTNQGSFHGFKKDIDSECKVVQDISSLIRDWF